MKYINKYLYTAIILISMPALCFSEPGEAAFTFVMIYRFSQIILGLVVFAGILTTIKLFKAGKPWPAIAVGSVIGLLVFLTVPFTIYWGSIFFGLFVLFFCIVALCSPIPRNDKNTASQAVDEKGKKPWPLMDD